MVKIASRRVPEPQSFCRAHRRPEIWPKLFTPSHTVGSDDRAAPRGAKIGRNFLPGLVQNVVEAELDTLRWEFKNRAFVLHESMAAQISERSQAYEDLVLLYWQAELSDPPKESSVVRDVVLQMKKAYGQYLDMNLMLLFNKVASQTVTHV